MTRGVIGNTSGFGSEESRFEPWRVNQKKGEQKKFSFFCWYIPACVVLFVKLFMFLVVKKETSPQRYTELHREKHSVVLCVLCGKKEFNHEAHNVLHKVH